MIQPPQLSTRTYTLFPHTTLFRSQMRLLGGEPGALTRACIGDDVYLIPRRDGKILAGSTLEHQGFDLSLSETVRDDLHQRAKRIWPGVGALPVIGHWAGLRPYANQIGRASCRERVCQYV